MVVQVIQLLLMTQHKRLFLQQLHPNYNGYEVSGAGLNDGFIEINLSGGESPYIYSWIAVNEEGEEIIITSENQDLDNPETLINLVAGFYTLTVTDNLLCSETFDAIAFIKSSTIRNY